MKCESRGQKHISFFLRIVKETVINYLVWELQIIDDCAIDSPSKTDVESMGKIIGLSVFDAR
jgi:hypothetical protein